jgi:hypothetical protein
MEEAKATFQLSTPIDVDAEEDVWENTSEQMFRLFTEPPHTSNFLQAVDVIAKQVHTAYDKRKKRFLIEKHGKDKWRDGDLSQGDFLGIVLSIWPHWSSKEERQNAFRKELCIYLLSFLFCLSHCLTFFFTVSAKGGHNSRWIESRVRQQTTGSCSVLTFPYTCTLYYSLLLYSCLYSITFSCIPVSVFVI